MISCRNGAAEYRSFPFFGVVAPSVDAAVGESSVMGCTAGDTAGEEVGGGSGGRRVDCVESACAEAGACAEGGGGETCSAAGSGRNVADEGVCSRTHGGA